MQRRELYFAVIVCCFLCPGFARAQSPVVIEGSVVNSVTGQPIPEARVKLRRPDAEPLYARTDAQGRFQFAVSDWPASLASAAKPGFVARTTYVGIASPAEPMKLELVPLGVIAGRVTDPNGSPLQNCPIEILRKLAGAPRPQAGGMSRDYESISTGARTNDLGEFRAARLEAGTYYVMANTAGVLNTWPEEYRSTYYPRALDLASAKPLQLAPGREVRADIQLVRREGVLLKGHFTFPEGQQTPAGRMRYTNLVLIRQPNYLLNASGPFTMARTDEFEFASVVPGKYTLMALTRERPAGDPWGGSDKSVFGIAREIDVKDSGPMNLDLALQPLRDLTGVVRFAEGCSPVPVLVRARGISRLAVAAAEAMTGADGGFVLRGLTPARYSFTFSSASSPFRWFLPVSAGLGRRSVLTGFDYPPAGNDTLKIVLGCNTNRRPQ